MGRLFKSRLAISSAAALLIIIMLLGALTSALLYISSLQMQNVGGSGKPLEQLSEAEREDVKASLISSSDGLEAKVKNTGMITLTITHALLTQADGSLTVVDVYPDVVLVPLQEENITVPYSGAFVGFGFQTERGNVFPVVTGNAPRQLDQYAVTFYVRDASGNPVSGATVIFGVSYSDGQSASVEAGSYLLSAGTIPSGYTFSEWVTSGGVSVVSSSSSSTTATVSGDGSITLWLAPPPSTATVTFSASSMSSDASGTVLTVDGAAYSYADLPIAFAWAVGSSHSFSWSDPVGAGTGKRYVWVSTTGLSTSKSGTIVVSSGGGSVSATYKAQYSLTVQVNPNGGGSASPSSGWRDAGSSVQISATPASGWTFESWSGSGTGSYTGTSNPATITMDGPITETANFVNIVAVTLDAKKTSGARFNSNPDSYVLHVDGNAYYYNQLPITFYWTAGSSHYVSWSSPVYSYATGSGAEGCYSAHYDWQYSTGIFALQSGTLVVPSGGGSVTAYYKRYVLVSTSVDPYNGGSVSPSATDYYPEGQTFTGTASSDFRLEYWSTNYGDATTNTYVRAASGTIQLSLSCNLKAVFYRKVYITVYDAEYCAGRGVSVSFAGQTVQTDYYGTAVFYAPVNTYQTLSVPSSVPSGVSGYSLPFWKSKSSQESSWYTSIPRSVYVYNAYMSISVLYKCILRFETIYATWYYYEAPPSLWLYTDGVVDSINFRGEHGINGVTVTAVWHVGDPWSSRTYTGTDTTSNVGKYGEKDGNFIISLHDYAIITWGYVEVTASKEGYVGAYWTNG